MARIQIVGVVRFSVLAPDYWSDRYPDIDEIRRHLFDGSRLEHRLKLFEALCLPSLARQTEGDFSVAVLTSRELPARYRERLADLLAPLPNARLVAVRPAPQFRLLQRAFADLYRPDDHSHAISFRLDDDDAVDLDFVARLRRFGEALLPLVGERGQVMIAHNRGFYLEVREGQANKLFDARERAPLSVGAALLGPMSDPGNPYRFNHRRFAQHYNLYSNLDSPAFIRTIHAHNKSRPTPSGVTGELDAAEITAILKDRFGLDAAGLLHL